MIVPYNGRFSRRNIETAVDRLSDAYYQFSAPVLLRTEYDYNLHIQVCKSRNTPFNKNWVKSRATFAAETYRAERSNRDDRRRNLSDNATSRS